jgi:class 3 adenylate cyclase/HAMP domain-containing protein
MSFRLKTILLVLAASLLPYISVIVIFGYELKSDAIEHARDELESKAENTANIISHELRLLKNDLNATASSEIMVDILTSDLDKRIVDTLLKKKNSFGFIGDYYVTDLAGQVIASTNNSIKVGEKLKPTDSYLTQPIALSFKNETVGLLSLDYKKENYNKFFTATKYQKFLLLPSTQPEPKELIVVTKHLEELPSMKLVATIDENGVYELYNKAEFSIFLAFLIGMLLIVALAYVFANKNVKPLVDVSLQVSQIADSKEYSKRLAIGSDDEIGAVAKSFNYLLESIEDALSKLKIESQNKILLVQEKSKSETLKEVAKRLSKYLSPQIVERIFTGEQEAQLESKRKKLTVFFSDIVSFTSTTDTMEAEDLSEILNLYLNEMSQIALQYGATIDKFIGDAVMVFFGDPKTLGDRQDAVSSVKMALAMKNRLEELGELWLSKGITKPFSSRMGIHTGYCTVGNFGSEERMDYTVIGSSVNLASRIESSAKPNQILISEETYLLVKDEINCSFAGEVAMKGLTNSVKVYEVKDDKAKENQISIKQDGLNLKINLDEVDKALARQTLQDAIDKL